MPPRLFLLTIASVDLKASQAEGALMEESSQGTEIFRPQTTKTKSNHANNRPFDA